MKKKRKQRLRRIAARTAERRREREGVFVDGVIHVAPGGYGFVSPLDPSVFEDDEDIFIPAKYIDNAMHGDTVKVRILPPRKGHPEDLERGPVGRIADVISRARKSFIAELLPGSMVRPLNTRLPEFIAIHGPRHGAENGDWVNVELDDAVDGQLSGVIRGTVGKVGNISADLDAVMAEYELPGKYSPEEEEDAVQTVPAEIERKDIRDLTVLTIDPFDAKDFDDALSVRKNDDGTWDVGIHIADVAAYIRQGSKFDKLARMRAFSCYLPGRTLPMLPAGLTAKISMQQDQDSLAHSVFLTVDSSGKVISGRREHTIVKVTQRLDYDEVQDFIDSGVCGQWAENTAETLASLVKIVSAMREYREKTEMFIDLPLPEVRVVCDEKNNIVQGIEKRFSRLSEKLVEECMLAANQFVGLEMPQRSVAGIYRVHPEPDPEKTMEFSENMHEAFNLSVGDISDRKCCRDFIASLEENESKNLILNMILRSMARASYAVKGEIHFALGKTFYAHFTSPIRRYTDLTVHQQLWNLDTSCRTRNASALEALAIHCSETEERIDNACFAAGDRLKIRILEAETAREPGKIYQGIVTRVLNSSVQVELPEYGIYAFVPNSQISAPQYTVKIGSVMKLNIAEIDRMTVFMREAR